MSIHAKEISLLNQVKGVSSETDVSVEQLTVSNNEFLGAVFHELSDGGNVAICRKQNDPTDNSGWIAEPYSEETVFDSSENNYFNTASFKLDEHGTLRATKANFCAMHAVILDDVGTKIPLDRLGDLKCSAKIETSPGNTQVILILEQAVTDIEQATKLQKAFVAAGLCDPGASGACRWGRLPVGINGKEKYRENGQAFQCRLMEWNPAISLFAGRRIGNAG